MKKILMFVLFMVAYSHLNAQLVIYQNFNQSGTSATCVSNTIFKGTGIPGGLNNNIKSITLSQGYMATLAANENGTGESFCYVAAVSNVTVNLAFALQDKVSFIRVLPLANVKKRGACTQNDLLPDTLSASWFYDWGTNDVTTPNREYALMTWGSSWITETRIDGYINKPGITSLLSFNEPDAAGQANILVGNAVPLYKKVLRTGYRMGSPATTEGEWDNWLLDFMNLARQDTLRVDYIAIHWYDWGNWLSTLNPSPSASSVLTRFKSYINAVYNLYKKPIWVTEFNCNVNRTSQTHLDFMALALPYLDSDPRIERYSYFFEDHIPETSNGSLTPIGQLYSNHVSTPAFTSNITDTRSASPELVSWNTSAITGGGQSVANFMPTYVAPNMTVISGLQRGAGTSFSPLSVSNGFWGNNGFARVSAAHGIDSNKVLTFSLQSTNGKNVSYTTIDSFKIRIAGNGPIRYQVDYRINSGTFMPITTITGPPRTTGNYSLPPVDLSGIAALQNVPSTSVVTFRITPFDCTGDGVFYFGGGATDPASDFSITGRLSDNMILPVTLSAFNSQNNSNKIKLTWTTQSENSLNNFLLERSTDGRNYSVITNIKASGNFSGSSYSYEDLPALSNPNYFYRLKMIDDDGKYTYSRVLVESVGGKKSLALYPNIVAGNQMTVVYSKVSAKAIIRIITSDGKTIKHINLNEGSGYETVDLSNLASGMYVLVLQDASGIQTSRFVKQ
jgi:Glycosyl hydrolase catalytic core/Secretion system C-terminal sorting domain